MRKVWRPEWTVSALAIQETPDFRAVEWIGKSEAEEIKRHEIKLRLLNTQSYNGMTDLIYTRR